MSTSKSKVLENKIKGALFGAAIGDAMGATTEFMTKEQIAKTYGQVTDIIGGGWLHLKPGQVTDDTQMSMCVMDALMNTGCAQDFIHECGNNFIKWYNGGPLDVGNQCAKGIKCLIDGKSIPVDNEALGNGSLMRALPCAIVNKVEYNILQGKMTHNSVTCDDAIITYHHNINAWMDYGTKFIDIHTTPVLLEPTGHVVNTLNNAIYYVNHANSFEEGMIKVVNDGGDADTIASLAGGLLGARFGFGAIPKRWANALDLEVVQMLNKFTNWAIEARKVVIEQN